MGRLQYELMDMLDCMSDSAHDKEQVSRVSYVAPEIAGHEQSVNDDVLMSACSLHTIGGQKQFENPKRCHAIVGAEKADNFLLSNRRN